MNKLSPHLPPPTCFIKAHEQWFLIKWIFITVILSLLSGLTAGLFAISWFFPNYNNGESVYLFNQSEGQKDLTGSLDQNFIREVRYRLLKIYDKKQIMHGGFYPKGAELGLAALLSSNGWSVFYRPEAGVLNINSLKNNWIGVDANGNVYNAEKAVFDSFSGFILVKFNGEEFRVNQFIKNQDLKYGESFWSVGDNWEKVFLTGKEMSVVSPFRPDELYIKDKIYPKAKAGTILINDQGDLVGLSDNENRLLPIWRLEQILPDVLGNKSIENSNLGWKGFFVGNRKTDGEWQDSFGFYISTAPKIVNGIKIGDVIIEINNEKISEETLFEQIIKAGKEFDVKVVRGGEEAVVKVGR